MRVDPFQSRRTTLPIIVSAVVAPGTAEVRDPCGRTAVRIVNLDRASFGDATAAQIGEQELERR